jgi:hypothetical protein
MLRGNSPSSATIAARAATRPSTLSTTAAPPAPRTTRVSFDPIKIPAIPFIGKPAHRFDCRRCSPQLHRFEGNLFVILFFHSLFMFPSPEQCGLPELPARVCEVVRPCKYASCPAVSNALE